MKVILNVFRIPVKMKVDSVRVYRPQQLANKAAVPSSKSQDNTHSTLK